MNKLRHGEEITWMEGTKRYKGTVLSTWNDGAVGAVLTPDGETMYVRAEQLRKPSTVMRVKVNLTETEALAVEIMSGRQPSGSVTEQMLKLAAGFLDLLKKAPA